MRTAYYPSDLTDRQWECIKGLLPRPTRRGRPRVISLRSIINAVLYLHHTGCPWRYLPKTYPKWTTVYRYFARWSTSGQWLKLTHELHKLVRQSCKRSELPHLAIIDSQSVKASKGEKRGTDGFKKLIGRRRHVLVDVLGIVLCCKVYEGNLSDADGGERILDHLPKDIDDSLETIVGDASYGGRFWAKAHVYHNIDVVITRRRGQSHKSNLIPKRWIVERTFAWFNNYRRLARDYELKTIHSEAFVYISMLPILLHRIGPN